MESKLTAIVTCSTNGCCNATMLESMQIVKHFHGKKTGSIVDIITQQRFIQAFRSDLDLDLGVFFYLYTPNASAVKMMFF